VRLPVAPRGLSVQVPAGDRDDVAVGSSTQGSFAEGGFTSRRLAFAWPEPDVSAHCSNVTPGPEELGDRGSELDPLVDDRNPLGDVDDRDDIELEVRAELGRPLGDAGRVVSLYDRVAARAVEPRHELMERTVQRRRPFAEDIETPLYRGFVVLRGASRAGGPTDQILHGDSPFTNVVWFGYRAVPRLTQAPA
jgi:hypothetical protein